MAARASLALARQAFVRLHALVDAGVTPGGCAALGPKQGAGR